MFCGAEPLRQVQREKRFASVVDEGFPYDPQYLLSVELPENLKGAANSRGRDGAVAGKDLE